MNRVTETLSAVKRMTREELTEVATMPDGRLYSYWRDGWTMKADERMRRGAAKRELARRLPVYPVTRDRGVMG